jgi:hypothetical protein
VLLIVILVILSLMFGGFQKGTKSSGLGRLTPLCATCTYAPAHMARGGPNS